jgi:8-oxo-dGTP pyrophosphatase MutT (NUDIX family)
MHDDEFTDLLLFLTHWCMAAPIPRDASSVIIVRSGAEGAQALLIRRDAKLAFAGGAWVFPGGKLEPADGSEEPATDDRGSALIVAACRETFEETGIVLACHENGDFCAADLADELQRFRADVSQNAGLFASVLVAHGLTIVPERLILWSHWITPSIVPKRFDTRFFVSSMPPGQIVRCESAEAAEFRWLDLPLHGGMPDESLVQAPPTRFSLGDLALALHQRGSLGRLMQAEAARSVVPIMPKMLRIDGRMTALMPWDPEYQAAPGEGVPADAEIPPQYLQFPSRIVPNLRISGMPTD